MYGVLAGALFTIGTFRFVVISKTESLIPLGIFIIVFFVTGICWGFFAKAGGMSLPKGLLFGVVIGGVIDVTYGSTVEHEDRGLAGIEILMYLLPATVAILLGTALGRFFRRFA